MSIGIYFFKTKACEGVSSGDLVLGLLFYEKSTSRYHRTIYQLPMLPQPLAFEMIHKSYLLLAFLIFIYTFIPLVMRKKVNLVDST